MSCSYVRNGVWGWPTEMQVGKLRDAGALNHGRLHHDGLRSDRAKRPSHIKAEWLTAREAMLEALPAQGGGVIYVATLLAFAVSEADLISALTTVAARQATVITLDSGLQIEPGAGIAAGKAAVDEWNRARMDARGRPGRAAGSRTAAERRRRLTLEKLAPARPLWRDITPGRLTALQIAERVGLSKKTLFVELGRRPEIGKGKAK